MKWRIQRSLRAPLPEAASTSPNVDLTSTDDLIPAPGMGAEQGSGTTALPASPHLT